MRAAESRLRQVFEDPGKGRPSGRNNPKSMARPKRCPSNFVAIKGAVFAATTSSCNGPAKQNA